MENFLHYAGKIAGILSDCVFTLCLVGLPVVVFCALADAIAGRIKK